MYLRMLERPENKTPIMIRTMRQQITQFANRMKQQINVLFNVQQDFLFLEAGIELVKL